MQRFLQEKYKARWEPISPNTRKGKLLWMIGKIGAVIDLLKKHGEAGVCAGARFRNNSVEELADVLMCDHDVLLCYAI